MNKNRRLLTFLLLAVVVPAIALAQSRKVTLDLIISPEVENAQTLSLSSLGIDLKGKGKKVIDIIIRNETAEAQKDLYFWIKFEAARFGTIAELVQKAGSPFSMTPLQLVLADNTRLENGFPGISESIKMEVVNDRSQEFINTLGGTTSLPDDVYTFSAELRQGGNTSDKTIANFKVSIGAKPVVQTVNLFLLQPGNIVGTESSISNSNPLFRWDGPISQEYRLIVVRATGGQQPPGLFQQAIATSPMLNLGVQTGTLSQSAESEIVDAIVQGTSFTLPVFGTQKLVAGQKYYWQVFTVIKSGTGSSIIPSEIWEFTFTDQSTSSDKELADETIKLITPFVSAEIISLIQQKGFVVDQMVIDEQTVTGTQSILIKLQEFAQKITDKKVTLVKQ